MEAEKYFPSIQEGIWSLITILNASDWPDPIIPAFEDSQLYFIYFFSFLVIGSWGLLNASSGLVFTFFRSSPHICVCTSSFPSHRDQQQQIRTEITFATCNLISRSYEILSSNATLSPTDTISAPKLDGIAIDLFKNLLRAHSWRFPPLEGFRKPRLPSELYSDARVNGKPQEGFDIDLQILLLILWRTYQSCHNSDLCSTPYSNLEVPPLPFDDWTAKLRDKFDIPPELSLIDVAVSENPELMQSVRKLLGGCSCSFSGPFGQHSGAGDRVPREMFIQFFLVTILKADSEFFDLSSIGVAASESPNINLDTYEHESKLSKISFSLLSSEASHLNSQQLDSSTHHIVGETPHLLKRKSRRFFTAVTDVFVSPVVRPIYFNEGWRQCWLASRFLFRERPQEYPVKVFHLEIFFRLQWWRSGLERIVGSQEFDLLTDAMFATVMVVFLGFFPSVGLMVTWTSYAVLETILRISFKGRRRLLSLLDLTELLPEYEGR